MVSSQSNGFFSPSSSTSESENTSSVAIGISPSTLTGTASAMPSSEKTELNFAGESPLLGHNNSSVEANNCCPRSKFDEKETEENEKKKELEIDTKLVKFLLDHRSENAKERIDHQNVLSECYKVEYVVSKDLSESSRWREMSAEQGDSEAQCDMGLRYYYGNEGVEQDFTKAFGYFELSAMQENADAQLYLAYCYHNGIGVQKDDAEALQWCKLSDAQGKSEAKGDLRRLRVVAFVTGLKLSEKQLTEAFLKSKRKKYSNILHGINQIPMSDSSDSESKEGHFLLTASLIFSADSTFLCQKVIAHCSNHKSLDALPDKCYITQTGWSEIFRSLKQHHTMPSYRYGMAWCFYNGKGVQKDYRQAFYYAELAAQQGNPCAQFLLGLCYLHGYGVPKDEKKAIQWLELSSEQNNAEAKFLLGECDWLQSGLGEEKEENEVCALSSPSQQEESKSKPLAETAAAKGYQEAIALLENSKKERANSSLLYKMVSYFSLN